MKLAQWKQTIPGFALLIGIMAGTALSQVPSAAAEATDSQVNPSRFICSRSCKPCSTHIECGPNGGSCGAWRCVDTP